MKQIVDNLFFFILVLNILLLPYSPVRIVTGLSGLLFLAYGVFLLLIRDRKFKLNILDIGIVFFICTIIISCLFSIDILESFSYLEKLILKPFLFYFGIRLFVESHEKFEVIFLLLLLSYVMFLVYSLVIGISYSFKMPRFSGAFKAPTEFSRILDLILWVLIAGFLGETSNFIRKSIFFIFILLSLLFLAFSGTRGAWISNFIVFVGFLFFALIKKCNVDLVKKILIFFFIFFLSLFIYASSRVCTEGPLSPRRRLASLIHLKSTLKKDIALRLRLDFYKTAFVLFKERPITGWGFGRKTPKLVVKKLGGDWFAERKIRPFYHHAHNAFLEILFEAGLIGFLGYVVLLLSIFWESMKQLKFMHMNSRIKLYKLFLLFSIIAIIIHSFVTYYFQTPVVYLFFVHLALISSTFEEIQQVSCPYRAT